MSSPVRALLLVAALLLAWSAGRSELLLREWRDWRAWRAGEPVAARPAGPSAAPAGAAVAAAPAAAEEPLLRALALMAEALARRETGAGDGLPVATPPAPAPAMGGGEAALARAMAGMAREGAADRAALADALSVLALALAERERGAPLVSARAQAEPAAGQPAAARDPGPAATGAQAAADPAADSPRQRAAWALADRGYAALRVGERRTAAESFAGALALAPDHPQARAWQREERRLTRLVRLEGYSLLRAAGDAAGDAVGATPALGAGGAAATVVLRPRPLARRPVEFHARYAIGQSAAAGGIDPETGQVALGVAWRPAPRANAQVAVERLIAAGALARDDWAVRVAGGREAALKGVTLSGYGEAGVIPDGFDWFAGGQASAEKRGTWRGVSWGAGAGLWAAGQATDGQTVGRVDIGPLVRLQHPSVPAVLQIDYRLRAAGEAEPGSGPTVTLSSSF